MPDPTEYPTVEPTLAMGVNTVLRFLLASTKWGAEALRGILSRVSAGDSSFPCNIIIIIMIIIIIIIITIIIIIIISTLLPSPASVSESARPRPARLLVDSWGLERV